MGKPTGFLEFPRQPPPRRPAALRVLDWGETYHDLPTPQLRDQAGRCMNCGVPFCQKGCPLGNYIADWNDLVYRGRWKDALFALLQTNPFPEFTGRVCPAPCEEACVLHINDQPVIIEHIEKQIIERAFTEGWIVPRPPAVRSGKRVAVIGSGPAGLAAAARLNQAGHLVTVFERDDRIGGLLTYGIPTFKLATEVVARRVSLLAAEGVVFRTGVQVGRGLDVEQLRRDSDALVLCTGATRARDLALPGRELDGIHLAMDYLVAQNRRNLGDRAPDADTLSADGKQVVILGGGDTGADCLGTAHRQGARSVHQFEIMPQPPTQGEATLGLPGPLLLRSSAAHEEGGVRDFGIRTLGFSGRGGVLQQLHAERIHWTRDPAGQLVPSAIPGSAFAIDCQLCLLALGFLHPEPGGLLAQLGVALDARGNVAADAGYMTNLPGVFAAGDMHRGQSLVVWALAEGQQAASAVCRWLQR